MEMAKQVVLVGILLLLLLLDSDEALSCFLLPLGMLVKGVLDLLLVLLDGGERNTLVLSMHLALASHEHKRHPSIHEHEHVKFHFINLLFITCDIAYILTYACDHV